MRIIEKGVEEIFKVVMAEYFSKLMLDTKTQIHKAQRTQSKIHTKKCIPRYVILSAENPRQGGNLERS